jgi:hypothetical protein
MVKIGKGKVLVKRNWVKFVNAKNAAAFVVTVGLIFFTLNHTQSTNTDTSTNNLLRSSSSSVSSNAFDECPMDGESTVPVSENGRLIIDCNAMHDFDFSRMDSVLDFTIEAYQKFMAEPAGKEHYRLIHYLSKNYADCRHMSDIGTRYVASSLAVASGRDMVPIWTFDLPESRERFHAFGEKSEEEWIANTQHSNANITFYNVDLLKIADDEFARFFSTWFVMLDTHHLPDTVPFEREFMSRLLRKELSFSGVLLLDDIHLNKEMRKWWKELQDDAPKYNYRALDLTECGHFSGTGLLDFSGKVDFVPLSSS